jgi:hypothetical protein
MQPINTHGLTPAVLDLINISSNYKIFHYDEFPILYFGTNEFQNKIIGSHLEEDDDTKRIWCLHTVVSNKQFYKFIHRKITYLELLQNSDVISLIEKDYDFNVLKAYQMTYDQIPQGYRPLEISYCPDYKKDFSYQFSLGLKGKIADINRAIIGQVSIIEKAFAAFIMDRVNHLKNLDLKPITYLEPYEVGSFKINIALNFEQQTKPNLFIHLAPIDEYLHEYLHYLTTNFVRDKNLIIDNLNFEKSDEYKKLIGILESIYDKTQTKKPKNIEEDFKEDIEKAVIKFEKLTDEIGTNFDSIEFSNVNNDKEEFITCIDKNFSEALTSTVEEFESLNKKIIIDDEYKKYTIYIYHLNTDTRIGNAFINNYLKNDEMSKPKIKINGDEPLEKTKYTESLYMNKWIDVQAKAKRIDEKYRYLEVKFED